MDRPIHSSVQFAVPEQTVKGCKFYRTGSDDFFQNSTDSKELQSMFKIQQILKIASKFYEKCSLLTASAQHFELPEREASS